MRSSIYKAFFKESGFTLIEVLVVVAVTGILTILATAIFINTVRNSKKAEITAEARQNAALVIDRLQKDSRGAISLLTTADKKTLTVSQPGKEITWNCVDAVSGNDNGYLTRDPDGASQPAPALTITNRDDVDGVSVTACSFEATSPNLVKVDFTLSEGETVNSGPQEYGVDLPFNTSISTRQTQ